MTLAAPTFDRVEAMSVAEMRSRGQMLAILAAEGLALGAGRPHRARREAEQLQLELAGPAPRRERVMANMPPPLLEQVREASEDVGCTLDRMLAVLIECALEARASRRKSA